jgi:DNA-binding transcriptional LysR family regulator
VLAGATSLADGARHLNVTPPAVTQRLKAMEARLGVRLIERGAKGISLTDEGALVLERARDVAQALDTLSEDLARRSQRVTGHLRIAAPYGFGRDHVAPAVAAFTALHPHLTVTLDLSDAPAARLLDRCDIVIHIGESSRARSCRHHAGPQPAYPLRGSGLSGAGPCPEHARRSGRASLPCPARE